MCWDEDIDPATFGVNCACIQTGHPGYAISRLNMQLMVLAGLPGILPPTQTIDKKLGTLQQALQALRIESSSSTIATNWSFPECPCLM